MTERRRIRWNGDGRDGTEDWMERKVNRWNGEGPKGTERLERTERLEGPERLEGTERDQIKRRGISWNGGVQDGTEGTS